MSASKETLDAGSNLLGDEQEVDESKLSWLQRRKLRKQRAAAEKAGQSWGKIYLRNHLHKWRPLLL